jgi:hypothetical protein
MAPTSASNPWEDHRRIPDLPDDKGGPSSGSDEDEDFTYPDAGDYSTQMEELFDGEDDTGLGGEEHKPDDDDEEDDEEEGFFYTGVDAVGYKERLRDVLGQDEDGDEEVNEVERSLLQENGETSFEEDELPVSFFFRVFLFLLYL